MTTPDLRLARPPRNGPVPTPTLLSAPYWAGCSRRELRFQRCAECDRANFEPAPACRFCGSTELRWETSSGTAELYSWTVIWRPQAPEFEVPYACGIVTMAEGHQVLATIADCSPDELADGLALVCDFQPTDSGQLLPFFRPDPRPDHRGDS